MIVKYVVCGCEHIAGVVIQGLGGGPSSIRADNDKEDASEQEKYPWTNSKRGEKRDGTHIY